MEELDDLPGQLRGEIEHFFSIYKVPEGKEVEVQGWEGREVAEQLLDDARSRRSVAGVGVDQRQQRLAGREAPARSRPRARRGSARSVASGLATCGVISARGSVHSGWPSGSGSGSVTSSAAPAIAPRARAATSASVSTSAPRATLTSHASLAHRLELGGADQVPRVGRGGRRDHDVVRPRQTRRAGPPGSVPSRPRRVTAQDLDAQRLEQLDQRPADAAGADDRHRRAVQRGRPAAASSVVARAHVGEPPRAGEHERQRVLGDRPPVGARGRGPRRSPSILGSHCSTPADGSCTQRTPLRQRLREVRAGSNPPTRGRRPRRADRSGRRPPRRPPRRADRTRAPRARSAACCEPTRPDGDRPAPLRPRPVEVVRRAARARRARPRAGRRDAGRRARPQRRRQVDAAGDPRRPRAAGRRHRHAPARARPRVPAPARARRRAHAARAGCAPPGPSWPSWRASCTRSSAGWPTRGWPPTSTP